MLRLRPSIPPTLPPLPSLLHKPPFPSRRVAGFLFSTRLLPHPSGAFISNQRLWGCPKSLLPWGLTDQVGQSGPVKHNSRSGMNSHHQQFLVLRHHFARRCISQVSAIFSPSGLAERERGGVAWKLWADWSFGCPDSFFFLLWVRLDGIWTYGDWAPRDAVCAVWGEGRNC